jgi:hypothetical protein
MRHSQCRRDFFRDIEESRVARGPSGGDEFGVGHALVRPPALAHGVARAWRRKRKTENRCQAGITVGLRDRLGVGDIEYPRHPAAARCDEMIDRRCRVVAVDLVDIPVAVLFEDRGAAEEFLQQDGSSGTIDAGDAGDGATRIERYAFGGEEDPAGFAVRFGGGFLRDDRAVGLRIDGCAGGEEEGDARKESGQIAHAGEIDMPVCVGTAPAGCRAMHDGIRCFDFRGDAGDGVGISEITGERVMAAGERKACDMPIVRAECLCHGPAEIAVAAEEQVWSFRVQGVRRDARAEFLPDLRPVQAAGAGKRLCGLAFGDYPAMVPSSKSA